jgi:IS30 family transposase
VFHRKDVITRHLQAKRPRQSWSLDCAPHIGTIDGKRVSIIVAVDDFTKFTKLALVDNLDSTATAKWFSEHIVAVHGKPEQVRIDNGNEWQGEFKKLLQTLNVHRRTIRPHAPWQNGRAERMVRSVKALIRRVMAASPDTDWRQLVPWVAFSINSTVSRSTGLEPHFIFYGEHSPPLFPMD